MVVGSKSRGAPCTRRAPAAAAHSNALLLERGKKTTIGIVAFTPRALAHKQGGSVVASRAIGIAKMQSVSASALAVHTLVSMITLSVL